MSIYKKTEYIDTLTVEHPDTPDNRVLIIPMGDCFLYNFWLDQGLYLFNDGKDKFPFAVEYTRYYDDACRKVHFITREQKQVFKKELYEHPKIGLYKAERKTLNQCNKKASDGSYLGPSDRQALFKGLEYLEKSENAQKLAWKQIDKLNEPSRNRFDKIQKEVVKEIVKVGIKRIEVETDNGDSTNFDIKSDLDDYDNFNYTGHDIVVSLDDDYDYDSGYYGW